MPRNRRLSSRWQQNVLHLQLGDMNSNYTGGSLSHGKSQRQICWANLLGNRSLYRVAIEKAANDPCIDSLCSNAATGGFQRHIHLARTTTFPGKLQVFRPIHGILWVLSPPPFIFIKVCSHFTRSPWSITPSALWLESPCLKSKNCWWFKLSDQNFARIAWARIYKQTPTLSPNSPGGICLCFWLYNWNFWRGQVLSNDHGLGTSQTPASVYIILYLQTSIASLLWERILAQRIRIVKKT